MTVLKGEYQERDKIWLVIDYWSVQKNFLTEFATTLYRMIPKTLLIEM